MEDLRQALQILEGRARSDLVPVDLRVARLDEGCLENTQVLFLEVGHEAKTCWLRPPRLLAIPELAEEGAEEFAAVLERARPIDCKLPVRIWASRGAGLGAQRRLLRGGPWGPVYGSLVSTCPRHGGRGVGDLILGAGTGGVGVATDRCAACGSRVLSGVLPGLRPGLKLVLALVKLVLSWQRWHLLLQSDEGHERPGEEAFYLTYFLGALVVV